MCGGSPARSCLHKKQQFQQACPLGITYYSAAYGLPSW
jgi:hypothetical protein